LKISDYQLILVFMIWPTLDEEKKLWERGYKLVCGVDEVGRGCFAGPVVAGAVIFPINCPLIKGVADSKLLKPKQREELTLAIKYLASSWSVGEIGVGDINEVGIGKATQLAFVQAIKNLELPPDFILIDAFLIKEYPEHIQNPLKNGDKMCASISAASIVAKVYRDALMVKLADEYPEYGFANHKGYGTREHQAAIKKHGLTKIHRKSFNLAKFL
jgi:ribonuclease HII